MNTEELVRLIVRRWDGKRTATSLVLSYGLSERFPKWFDITRESIEELIGLVQEALYGPLCDPEKVTPIGRARPVWI